MRTDLERPETAASVEPSVSVEPSLAPGVSASPSAPAAAFPTDAFAHIISEDRVSEKPAAAFQAILKEMAGGAGTSATVMTADGMWSGATGEAGSRCSR